MDNQYNILTHQCQVRLTSFVDWWEKITGNQQPFPIFHTTHLNLHVSIPCFACDAPCCKLRIQPYKKYDPKESWVKKFYLFFYYTLLKWDTGVEYKIGLFIHRERVRHVYWMVFFLFNLVIRTKPFATAVRDASL